MDDELKFLAAERQVVTTASKMEERRDKTIATTTVITQADIRQIGARNLLDVLRIVPGLGVTQFTLGIRQIEVRGIQSYFSEKVLFLLNGHPLDQNLNNAGSTWVYDDLPVDTIQRVEVVRGPGSALYGANAFLAVINIITQTAKDVDGVQASARWGSFDTQQYRVSAGKQFENTAEAALHFNFADTDGIASPVPEDAQSVQGKPSLAPGHSQLNERRYDLEWQLGYQGFKLDGRYINKTAGAFTGPFFALSDDTRQDYDNYFVRLSHAWDMTDDITINTQAYRDYFSFDNFLQANLSDYRRNALVDTRTGGELQGTYRVQPNQTLIAGLSYAHEEQYGVADARGTTPWDLLPLSSPFTQNDRRERWGVYGQDVWDPFSSLRLTLGARYDHYTGFGGTFNPRLGLNWEFIQDYSLKFSYGTAFRAPSFGELHLGNNSVLTGNLGLSPEKVETFEAGLIAHPVPGLTAQAVYYHSRISQIISLVSTQYVNAGSIVAQGVELEGRYDFGESAPGSYVALNYVYQDPKNQNGERVPDVPRSRLNLLANWAFDSHWSTLATLMLKGETGRVPGDPRGDVPGYAVVNLSLLGRHLYWEGADVSFTVYNLLDSKYYDPSPSDKYPPFPVNYQQAERAYFGHVSFKF